MPEHITAEPAGEPISLAEAKQQMNLETDEDDDFVGALISAARRHVEGHCNRAVLQQTWELVLDGFPHPRHRLYQHHSCGLNGTFAYAGLFGACRACDLYMELPRGHLADVTTPVTSVKYLDVNGALQTLATSEYSVDDISVPGRVHRAFGKTWPATRPQWDAVKVVYQVGWALDDVPENIKQAMLLLVSQMYEHRTPEVDSRALTAVLFSYEALLNPFRIHAL